jgi:predicted component of type VI protein secretion system
MLKELLKEKKLSIVDSWTQSVFETYQLEATKFFKLQKNQFSNPVGNIVSVNIEKIFDEMINDNNIGKIKSSLNDIVKIRAVQDFSPSQAIGFIYSLKKIINKELRQEIKDEKTIDELMTIESGIDNIALAGFDLYMEAREKIFQIRIKEIKSKSLAIEG